MEHKKPFQYNNSIFSQSLRLATTVARNGPIAIRAAKQAIEIGMEKATMSDALEVERRFYAAVLPTKDRLEGLASFRDGRLPNYNGD